MFHSALYRAKRSCRSSLSSPALGGGRSLLLPLLQYLASDCPSDPSPAYFSHTVVITTATRVLLSLGGSWAKKLLSLHRGNDTIYASLNDLSPFNVLNIMHPPFRRLDTLVHIPPFCLLRRCSLQVNLCQAECILVRSAVGCGKLPASGL